MTTLYIVRFPSTGNYRGTSRFSVSDIEKARLYKRKCDVKNSMRRHRELKYEIISCIVNPILPKRYYRVSSVLPRFYIRSDGSHFKPQVFDNLKKAEAYKFDAVKDCHLHGDYFAIEEITKEEYEKNAPPVQTGHIVPSWQDYFLGLALVVSQRSKDIHTQHGCVIVDSKTNHILGTGYNSFPRGMKDDTLPTHRPDPAKPDDWNKYDWMIHSEPNAVSNMTTKADEYTIAYVTGEPCTPCIMHMWQNGIQKVIHRNAYGSKYLITDRTRKIRDRFLADTGMRVIPVEADLSWLSQVVLPHGAV